MQEEMTGFEITVYNCLFQQTAFLSSGRKTVIYANYKWRKIKHSTSNEKWTNQ